MQKRSVASWGFRIVALGGLTAACAAKPSAPRPATPFVLQPTASAPADPEPVVEAPASGDAEIDRLDPTERHVPYRMSARTDVPVCQAALPKADEDATCATAPEALARLLEVLQRHAQALAPDPKKTKVCSSPYAPELAAVRLRREAYRPSALGRRFEGRLEELEACRGFAPGVVRLLRAHYTPDCADDLNTQSAEDEAISDELRWALQGFAAKSRFERRDFHLPPYRARLKRAGVDALLAHKLLPWLDAERGELERLLPQVEVLPEGTYGRGVAELALSRRWAALATELTHVQLEAVDSRRYLDEALRPTFIELYRQVHHRAAVASRSVPLIADRQLVETWASELHVCELDAARQVILPPLPPIASNDADAALALLPSYIAARVLPVAELSASQLRHMAVAGLDPLVRRALRSREEDAELLARTRLWLMLRSFQPGQAREAERLLNLPLSRVLASAPEGLESWASCQLMLDAKPLLESATTPSTTPLERSALTWNAMLLSGTRSTELFAQFAGSAEASDPAISACRSSSLFPRACACPSIDNL